LAAGPIDTTAYTEATPEGGFYNVSGMSDFDNDLCAWGGSWIVGPRTALVQSGGSTTP
jgi:hypothetical protein